MAKVLEFQLQDRKGPSPSRVAEKTLPFTLRTAASIHGAEVEVQSWLRIFGKGVSRRTSQGGMELLR